jgi:hypothetical protein
MLVDELLACRLSLNPRLPKFLRYTAVVWLYYVVRLCRSNPGLDLSQCPIQLSQCWSAQTSWTPYKSVDLLDEHGKVEEQEHVEMESGENRKTVIQES